MRAYFMLRTDQTGLSSNDPIVEEFYSEELDIDPFEAGRWTEEMRWYNFDEELKSFSQYYPTVLFTLDIEDQYGDRYRNYYFNGKVQNSEGRLVFDEFDENELQ